MRDLLKMVCSAACEGVKTANTVNNRRSRPDRTALSCLYPDPARNLGGKTWECSLLMLVLQWWDLCKNFISRSAFQRVSESSSCSKEEKQLISLTLCTEWCRSGHEVHSRHVNEGQSFRTVITLTFNQLLQLLQDWQWTFNNMKRICTEPLATTNWTLAFVCKGYRKQWGPFAEQAFVCKQFMRLIILIRHNKHGPTLCLSRSSAVEVIQKQQVTFVSQRWVLRLKTTRYKTSQNGRRKTRWHGHFLHFVILCDAVLYLGK